MLRQMPNRETNPRNPQNQPERRREDRRRERQPEGWPSDERRKDQRRENIQMAQGGQKSGQGPMAQRRDGMNSDSRPKKEHSSTPSQAQKAEGHTPRQQARSGERHEQGSHEKGAHEKGAQEKGEGTARYSKKEEREGNFGVTYDRGLGQDPGDQGAGGKTDSSQRDMGQTGQRK